MNYEQNYNSNHSNNNVKSCNINIIIINNTIKT